jgi:hypothetical protein
MMRPARPKQTASARPYKVSCERATRIEQRDVPNPRTLLLALCVVTAVLSTMASTGVTLAVTRAGVPVAQTSGSHAPVLQTARFDRASLSTAYDGPASCAAPGFLTGDTTGDANPVVLYRTLCQPVSADR